MNVAPLLLLLTFSIVREQKLAEVKELRNVV
jgi:hypothetical protein